MNPEQIAEEEEEEISESSYCTESSDENSQLILLNTLLTFERKQHRDDIFKNCSEFCRFMSTRPNIKTLEKHLFKISPCVCETTNFNYSNYNHQPSYAGCGSCVDKSGSECEIKREHWITTLLALSKFGCDEVAINATKQCKFCKIDRNLLDGMFTNEDPRNIQAQKNQIKELSKWKPDPNKLKKNVYD
ncbi:uncharacterized protein LOC123290880 [Chrysoperla carnea]|uniref:uncharacterized protein LOC123290880 n=1 Tax=Chrysoperla carnea TaxID=189513 RepID=UPI001D0975AB|nr:uncharacterized protein LOC123290880 [Chrysoperla carnea]